jgi:hypothetical protein
MVISPSGSQLANIDNKLTFNNTGSSTALDSFAQQLASELEGMLGASGNGSQIEINVQSGPVQSSGMNQFTITVTNEEGTSTPTAAGSSSSATTTTTTPSTPSTATTPATSPTSTATTLDKSDMTPTEAYWASQPVAVQALEYAPADQKYELAQQLAEEGYAIDVPIMVWGWDPLATMIQRQEEGYTWVPSAMQPGIEEEPGVSMPQGTPYDPNNPPPGSIQVSTAFADGTNMQDAVAQLWIQGETPSASSSNTISS